MNLRAPEAFVGVDVAHAAKDGLIEQQSFDMCFARVDRSGELRFGGFERIEAERAEHVRLIRVRQDSNTSETASVGVTQFAAIVEGEEDVRVRARGRFGRVHDELAGHAEMNEQGKFTVAVARGSEFKDDEFSVTADLVDAPAGEIAFERDGIVHEVRLAEAHLHDAPAWQDGFQPAHYGLDLR